MWSHVSAATPVPVIVMTATAKSSWGGMGGDNMGRTSSWGAWAEMAYPLTLGAASRARMALCTRTGSLENRSGGL